MSHFRRMFLPFFLGESSSKDPFQIQFLIFSWSVIESGSWCGPSDPILAYRNSESVPKFEIMLRLSDLYWMSEDVTFLSNVPSFLFEESSSKRPVSDPIF